jgi:hypothetical protein
MHRWKIITTSTKEEEEEKGDHRPRMTMTPHKRIANMFHHLWSSSTKVSKS